MKKSKFNIKKNKQSLDRVLRLSKAVIVGNKFLQDYVLPLNSNVHIIPTPVYIPDVTNNGKISDSKIIVGWIGNKENFIYLQRLATVFKKLTLTMKNRFLLKIICDEAFHLEGVPTTNKKWSLAEESKELASVDIGIMPLGSDDWSKGKCAFKILQYMSMGIPVVASPIGMNKEVITHGVNGYLAETEEECNQDRTIRNG